MTGPQHPQDPYRDDAARRIGEALQAQARGRPMPPRPGGPPAAPPPVPGRIPPPAPRPVPPQQRPAPARATPPAPTAGSPVRQIVWAAVIALLLGALLGGGIALVSVLLPGALPALG